MPEVRTAVPRRLLVTACTAVVLAGIASPPVGAARVDHPAATSCVQSADLGGGGGVYLDTDSAALMAGTRCRYTATTAGGYLAVPAADWRVVVHRPDGAVQRFSHAGGSPVCADGVIAPGDRVEISSSTTIAAGEHIGCES